MDSILPWLQFAASYQESKKSGTFVQPPMSPEQKQMFDWAMHYLETTPDNRQTINSILGYDLAHPATIDMAALKAGNVGYTPQGHMPGTDLAAMLRNTSSGAPYTPATGSPPTGLGGGSGPTGVPGDAFGNISSPAGSAGDPFAGMPGDQRPTDWNTLKTWAGQYGPAASAFAASLASGNPYMAIVGAGKAIQAYVNGQKPDANKDPQLPVKNPNYPLNELTPAGQPPPQAPRQNWNQQNPDPWAGAFTRGYQNAPGQVGYESGGGRGGYTYGYNDSDRTGLPVKGGAR